MPFSQPDGLRYFSFELLSGCSVWQGIFTRHGGVSPAPWDSLNHGGTVGDSRLHVIENRRRTFQVFDREVESIYDVWQVHGTKVICTDNPRPLDAPHREADGIATDKPGVTLFMRFADCVPLFFHDPIKGVVGIAHAGWKGTIHRIGAVMVETLQANYGCDPKNILVGIGPSISVERYQVGAEVAEQVESNFGDEAKAILHNKRSGVFLDLWEANRLALLHSGVCSEHIEVSGICTALNTGDWFSHRAESGKTGRFGALLALK